MPDTELMREARVRATSMMRLAAQDETDLLIDSVRAIQDNSQMMVMTMVYLAFYGGLTIRNLGDIIEEGFGDDLLMKQIVRTMEVP